MVDGQKKQSEFVKWMGPLLDGLRSFGGSAKPREVCSWIANEIQLSDEKLEETLQSGQTRFYNQVHWARQYLVWEDLLDGSRRGIWTLTKKGWSTHLSEEEGRLIFRKWVENYSAARSKAKQEASVEIGGDNDAVEIPPDEISEVELLTVSATREANREGAPPIELVDGEKLVSMFEDLGLGVRPRTVYEVDHSFFEQFQDESSI